jgi:hypothetical protein
VKTRLSATHVLTATRIRPPAFSGLQSHLRSIVRQFQRPEQVDIATSDAPKITWPYAHRVGVWRALAARDDAWPPVETAGRMLYESARNHATLQCPLFGYLLTCPRTGAWRGSV